MRKNDKATGYKIEQLSNGNVYHGEFVKYSLEGYGLMKYENDDEYDGQWKRNSKHGEGVFKEASTGRVERRLYKDDKVIEVLEVIEEGQ